MSQYNIERWDVVMFNNSVTKVPMIYVKPDLTFLDFIRNNNYAVMCEISGTGTIYDGKKIPGVVDKSCYVPNCRPNFYDKTGFYVITLVANWYGYPNDGNMGEVKFSGMKKPISNSYKHYGPAVEKAMTSYKEHVAKQVPKKNGMSTPVIIGIVSVIVAILVIIYMVSNFIGRKK